MLFVRRIDFLKSISSGVFIQRFTQHTPTPKKSPSCTLTEKSERKQIGNVECCKAVIVGGTGAIGLAIANQLFCAEAAKIALIDLDVCKGKDVITSLNCSFGKNKAIFIKSDATSKTEIQNALKQIKSEFEKVDVIVNAFGIWNETKWEYQLKTNLIGTLYVNEIAKEILTKPRGIIINIIGIPGIQVFPASPILATGFLGMIAFTQSQGHETHTKATGIRTVALCCGIIKSNFSSDVEKRMRGPVQEGEIKKFLAETCWQKPTVVGQSVIETIKYAESGSVWVVEGSRLFSLKIPDLNALRKLENQFV